MKQSIFALIILHTLSLSVHAQDGVVFKVQFKPQTKYTQTREDFSRSDMKYSGSPMYLRSLAERGVSNPTVSNGQKIVETVIKTGAPTNKGTIPLIMEYTKTTSSDGKTEIPDGTIIHGTVFEGKMPTLDSVVAKSLNKAYKATLLKGIQSKFDKLSFPEKYVKIGESFTIDAPLSMPGPGGNIQMNISSVYKLISIKDGMADFDILQIYSVTSNFSKADIKSAGSGKGKLTYDIRNNFYHKLQMVVDTEMHMEMVGSSMVVKSHHGFTQTTVISSNN